MGECDETRALVLSNSYILLRLSCQLFLCLCAHVIELRLWALSMLPPPSSNCSAHLIHSCRLVNFCHKSFRCKIEIKVALKCTKFLGNKFEWNVPRCLNLNSNVYDIVKFMLQLSTCKMPQKLKLYPWTRWKGTKQF